MWGKFSDGQRSPFSRFSCEVEKFVSQEVTWPATTSVFLPKKKRLRKTLGASFVYLCHFARAINTDVWQVIIARPSESQKNCSKPSETEFPFVCLVMTYSLFSTNFVILFYIKWNQTLYGFSFTIETSCTLLPVYDKKTYLGHFFIGLFKTQRISTWSPRFYPER